MRRISENNDNGFLLLIIGILMLIFGITFFFFIQNYTLILCANWFPIVMIIMALAFFFYMKNKGVGGKKK